MRFFLLVFGALLTGWLGSAWSLMVVVGIAHDSWWKLMPVMGYGTATAITAVSALTIFLSALAGAAIIKEFL